jgi:cysteine desulfurase
MPIYFDHNATSPLDPRVLEAMLPYLTGPNGNPSSVHRFGRAARQAVETAREQVAALVGAGPAQIVFTSGGTEANNLALKGVAARHPGARVLVSASEHAAVLEPAQSLAKHGWRPALIAVDANGRLELSALDEHLRGREAPAVVSVMLANNETGVIQDAAAVAARVRAAGSTYHCDAVQAAGKIPVNFVASGAQLMTLSAHKLYGPKGVGALIIDRTLDIEPLVDGGGQEKGMRGGTENVAAIAGFGVAAELAGQELATRAAHVRGLRDRLERGLQGIPGAAIFAAAAERLPNTVQFGVPGFESETLLMALDRKGIAVSSGSACHSGKNEPSHVLMAMGIPHALALSAIRVSFGMQNTAEEVDRFIETLRGIVGGMGGLMASVATG